MINTSPSWTKTRAAHANNPVYFGQSKIEYDSVILLCAREKIVLTPIGGAIGVSRFDERFRQPPRQEQFVLYDQNRQLDIYSVVRMNGG